MSKKSIRLKLKWKLWKQKYGNVPVGYVEDIKPNKDWKEMGLRCEWEHCIERMSVPSEITTATCPVFGHICPGGEKRATSEECKKLMETLLSSSQATRKWWM